MLLPRIFSAGARTRSAFLIKPPPPHLTHNSSLSSSPPQLLLRRPSIPLPLIPGVRWATHKASRPANKGKDGPGKRLGAKKTAGELVKSGNILYRQRGTLWYPGENVALGRDHTLYAISPGYVRYYRDPRHPKRKFIGVALHPKQTLPTPTNATTKRRLGRVAVPLVEIQRRDTLDEGEKEVLKSGVYYYRPPNWKLGLVKEELKRPYDPKNTWARWQKRAKRVKFAKARRGIGGKDPKAKKKQKRRA